MITTVPGAAMSEKCWSVGRLDSWGTIRPGISEPGWCSFATNKTVLMGATRRFVQPCRVGIGASVVTLEVDMLRMGRREDTDVCKNSSRGHVKV